MISGIGKSLKRFVTAASEDTNFDDLLAGLNEENSKSGQNNSSLKTQGISSRNVEAKESSSPTKEHPTIKQFPKKEGATFKMGSQEPNPKSKETQEAGLGMGKPFTKTLGGSTIGSRNLASQSLSGSDREAWQRIVAMEVIYEAEKQLYEHEVLTRKRDLEMRQEEYRSKLFETDQIREGIPFNLNPESIECLHLFNFFEFWSI